MKNSKNPVFLLGLTLILTTILVSCGAGNYSGSKKDAYSLNQAEAAPIMDPLGSGDENGLVHNTEEYERIVENPFQSPVVHPLSTFAIDVDGASYANSRRFLREGRMPYPDAVRIEEFVNYFTYDYPQPETEHPFSITTEVSSAPWNDAHKLVHIGLQGKEIPTENLPASNLVFLLDVSGSMNSYNKLPLLKEAFHLLVEQLRPQDKVSIAVYAGAAGLVLPPTPGDRKFDILNALDKLQAGGSTAGAEGIELAYKVAKENFISGGNNRVILATDGDFNVGVSSTSELERMIEQKREEGVFLTVLGFGSGNYKDSRMQTLANKGNGNASYIDNILEAKKVLVTEFGGTLFTIAKDVKIQVEFNPALVKGYRLIGYENRLLNAEDFNDDQKDAGEIGSGHSVTALYEIIPAGSAESVPGTDALRYQSPATQQGASFGDEIMTVKFRYKAPEGDQSKLITRIVENNSLDLNATSDNFRFSAAAAEFGLLLRDSKFKADATYEHVIGLAEKAIGEDPEGYRGEFISLVKQAQLLDHKLSVSETGNH